MNRSSSTPPSSRQSTEYWAPPLGELGDVVGQQALQEAPPPRGRWSRSGPCARRRTSPPRCAPARARRGCPRTAPASPSRRTERASRRRSGGGRTGACGEGCRWTDPKRSREATCHPSRIAAASASATSARVRSVVRADPLVRRVGAAAARAEAVDGQRDRLGDVAGVARAAALGGHQRAPEALARRPPAAGAVAARVSIPGQARTSVDSIDTPSSCSGTAVEHRAEGGQVVGAQVADEPPVRRDHVEGLARAQDRRHGGQPLGAGRVAAARPPAGPPSASASSALRPFSGAEPECAGAPVAWISQRPGGLALDDHGVVALRRRARPASKHRQASQPREALGVGERRPCATPRR